MTVPSGPGSQGYLQTMALDLLRFGAQAYQPVGGFGYLNQTGQADPANGRPLWITCRMTHCFSLGHLMGLPGMAELAGHGLNALEQYFSDQENGGWFSLLDDAGYPASSTKQTYGHAFVVLAASSAALAGLAGASELLDRALEALDKYLWEPEPQAVIDTASQDFSQVEPYRGANANMHTAEALMAASVATGQITWAHRALAISQRLIYQQARVNNWRIPEHYRSNWSVDLDYNQTKNSDQFRPYGATPGHGFEWARLLLQLQQQLGPTGPDWLGPAAAELYNRALADGWEAEPVPGLVYTTNWSGRPQLRQRLHWVMAEATSAAWVMFQATGLERYLADYQSWWQLIETHFVDRQHGSWFHELSPEGLVTATIWPGKPDIYHALQACLIPSVPLGPALAAGLLTVN